MFKAILKKKVSLVHAVGIRLMAAGLVVLTLPCCVQKPFQEPPPSLPATPASTPTPLSSPPAIPTSTPTPPPLPTGAGMDAVKAIAAKSQCASFSYPSGQGLAPKAFLNGMALVFARSVCNQNSSYMKETAKANTGDDEHDALSWYNANFEAAGLSNDKAGLDTLRHLYALMLGHGMMESSGQHCLGKDPNASNTSSETCEAGLWQTSWNSRTYSSELPKIFATYKEGGRKCFLETFSQGISCREADWENHGTDEDGLKFQELSKKCPAFAAEYAAVVLRNGRQHYGPINHKTAAFSVTCDAMFAQIQKLVETTPAVCADL